MDTLKQNLAFALAAVGIIAWWVVSSGDQPGYASIPLLIAGLLFSIGVTQRHLKAGALAASLLGLACAFYLFQLKIEATSGSFCSFGEVFDCGKVNASEWSMALGFPHRAAGRRLLRRRGRRECHPAA